MTTTERVRVRFAPSPTGMLHVGGLRTALYNYLFAKQRQGDFILRIEDTDQARKVEGATQHILSMLSVCGIEPDEGPSLQRDGTIEEFGPYGPYIQSKRTSLYREATDRLLKAGQAYHCFCTSERLDELRTIQEKKKIPTRYDGLCRALDAQEVEKRLSSGQKSVIRIKMPQKGTCTFQDIIRGEVTFSYHVLQDQVLLKSDGFPTYHLANVIDDHEMKITHIIRGEEWLPSVPIHLALYEAFDWTPPALAHLPMLLDEKRAKLSKRMGSVGVHEFLKDGILPEALINFILLLGWNSKNEKEIFSRDEMIQQFSLEHVHPSGAVFDRKKLAWMNKKYLESTPVKQIDTYAKSKGFIDSSFAAKAHGDAWEQFLQLVKDRIESLGELNASVAYFFQDPEIDSKMIIKKSDEKKVARTLTGISTVLEVLPTWNEQAIKQSIEDWITGSSLSRGEVLWPIRVALTGKSFSPGTYELLGLFNKETVLRRLQRAMECLQKA